MAQPTTKFGMTLREYRRKHSLTHRDVAEAVGVHSTYVQSIELGKNRRGPSVDLVYRLAAFTGEDPTEMLCLLGKVDTKRLAEETSGSGPMSASSSVVSTSSKPSSNLHPKCRSRFYDHRNIAVPQDAGP